MKTEKLGGVAGGQGECGDDVAGWLVRERRSLDILPVKKEAKLSPTLRQELTVCAKRSKHIHHTNIVCLPFNP